MPENIMSATNIIQSVGSAAGLLGAVYLFAQKITQKPKFKFKQYGKSGAIYTEDGAEKLKIRYSGILINQSDSPNSITEATYIVWDENSKYKSLSNGLILGSYIDESNGDKEKKLPIYFKPKESKKLVFTAFVHLTGSHDEELVKAQKPVREGSHFMLPKYEYEIGFVDTNGILFDRNGHIRSQKIVDLWWTLPNTFNALKRGNPFPYLVHLFKIFFAWIGFKIARLKASIGF